MSPLALLAVAAAMTDKLRDAAHEWIKTAKDYPHGDTYREGMIAMGIESALDKAEDVGEVIAEMLQGAEIVAVYLDDGHLVAKDKHGQVLDSFEIILPNSPGSEDLN